MLHGNYSPSSQASRWPDAAARDPLGTERWDEFLNKIDGTTRSPVEGDPASSSLDPGSPLPSRRAATPGQRRADHLEHPQRVVRDPFAEQLLALAVHRVDHRTTTMQIDPDVTSILRGLPSSRRETGFVVKPRVSTTRTSLGSGGPAPSSHQFWRHPLAESATAIVFFSDASFLATAEGCCSPTAGYSDSDERAHERATSRSDSATA